MSNKAEDGGILMGFAFLLAMMCIGYLNMGKIPNEVILNSSKNVKNGYYIEVIDVEFNHIRNLYDSTAKRPVHNDSLYYIHSSTIDLTNGFKVKEVLLLDSTVWHRVLHEVLQGEVIWYQYVDSGKSIMFHSATDSFSILNVLYDGN